MNIFDYKAAILDFDGTVIDSMNMWSEIDVEYLARYGHEPGRFLHDEIEGMSPEEMAVYFREKYGIPRTNEEMITDWVEMSVYKYRYELPLKPHVSEFITALRKGGLKTAIATSTATEIIVPCLRERGMSGLFDCIVTTGECGKGKPAPDVYLTAAGRLGMSPSECVAFEDLPAGIAAAKAAGMYTVAVDDSFSRSKEREKRELADLFIYDFADLLKESPHKS